MRSLRLALLSLALTSGVARAQDAAPADAAPASEPKVVPADAAPEAPTLTPSSNRGTLGSHWKVRDRFENGFDAKLTNLYDRKATNVEAPTVLLNAQWNYKFETDTLLGLGVGAAPQSMKNEPEDDGTQRSFTTYYGGLNIGQGIFDDFPFRLVVSVLAGKGLLYTREKIPGEKDTEMHQSRYTVYEPNVYATFFWYQGVEMGVIASYRKVALENHDYAEDSDLSGPGFGLTFRTQRH